MFNFATDLADNILLKKKNEEYYNSDFNNFRCNCDARRL